MSKHTPGPWTFTHGGRGDLSIKGSNNECVVSGCGCCDSPFGDNLEHDALLIAAAPDLLEALQDLYTAYCGVMRSEFDFPGRPWTPERDNDIDAIKASAAIQRATQ